MAISNDLPLDGRRFWDRIAFNYKKSSKQKLSNCKSNVALCKNSLTMIVIQKLKCDLQTLGFVQTSKKEVKPSIIRP